MDTVHDHWQLSLPAGAGMMDEIPLEHAQIDADLDAWGRWSRIRRGSATCGSAEGQYRANWRQWHYPTVEEMMPQPLARDMLAIDRAVVRLPIAYLELIRSHYVAKLPASTIRRRLSVNRDQLEAHLYRARQMVLNRMRRGENRMRD
jgi:DNA-directed RNA polymerase specialized sigma24 family protein